MKILGLLIFGPHDTGACLIDGEKIVAISQERLDRKKYSAAYPQEAINYCLSAVNLSIDDIDILAVEQQTAGIEPLVEILTERKLWPKLKSKTIFVNHHDAHAASAFFCSPFDDAAVIVVDNGGQTVQLKNGEFAKETESFYSAKNAKMELLHRNYQPINKKIRALAGISGIANLYSQVTYFINFGRNEEGKTMGLAPYGTNRFMNIPQEQFVKKISPWQYVVPTPLEPHPSYDWQYLFKKSSYSRKSGWINLLKNFYFPKRHPLFKSLPKQFWQAPRRSKNQKLPDEFYTDLAFWAQEWLEKVMIDYANYIYDITKSKNLCIAGGIGLNSVANKKILDATSFENIFIQPAAGDSGLALGCALWVKHQLKKEPIKWRMENDYLGRDYSEKEIINALEESGVTYKKLDNPIKTVTGLMAKEKIIGWFQGKSEHGPRALGNRSILCSPIPPGMKDKLNAQVKHRESFRPFAPVVLEEQTSESFDLTCPSPFMLLVAKIKKDNIPAVTHIDGTGRIQTISRRQNLLFYKLIEEFEKITGVPVVLNTSFNNNGEPIVESPLDAIKSFRTTNLDALIIHNYLIERQ